MKSLCGLPFVLVLACVCNSEDLVRNRRFISSLWPSAVKEDVQTGLTYSQLPPEYLYLLPGVNDHKIQRRAGDDTHTVIPRQAEIPPHPEPHLKLPARFVHPTRMAILMNQNQPQQQQRLNPLQQQNMKTVQPQIIQQQPQVSKIIMRPIMQTQNPSIILRTKDQALPDIHKNQRFVQPTPLQRTTQRTYVQPFNTQQLLPIKKAFETSPSLIESAPVLSIKTASINDFYFTKEFQSLLSEYKIKVDINKLPPITDVMAILGTDNAEETIHSMRDVASSKEGLQLIHSYLDQNTDRIEDHEFYNYDEDIGTGEILVNGLQGTNYNEKFKAPTLNEEFNNNQYNSFANHNYNLPNDQPKAISNHHVVNVPTRATTTGTITGSETSWWRPTTWLSSSEPARDNSMQTDSEILQNVVAKNTGSVWDTFGYIGKLFRSPSSETVSINPPFQVSRQDVVKQPVRNVHSLGVGGQKILPTVQMTEAQFQHMIHTLKLRPITPQHLRSTPVDNYHHYPSATFSQFPIVNAQKTKVAAAPSNVQHSTTIQQTETSANKLQHEAVVTEQKRQPIVYETTITSPKIISPVVSKNELKESAQPFTITNQNIKFQAPINVQGLPLPTLPQFQDNRRNFVAASEPQRAAPYDFIATGRVHQANPQDVLKKSRSIVEAIEGELKNLFV